MSNVEAPCYGPHPQTLEEFIEDSLQRSRERGYIPRDFLDGVDQHGLITEITRRVEGSEFKSGLLKVLELGLVVWKVHGPDDRLRSRPLGRSVQCIDA
jgi:hypothetical protein